MAKNKGKRPNRQKVSKERIAQASYAKAKGLLSKNAKLSGGRISSRVAKKITFLEELGAIPTYIFEAGMKRAHILDQPIRALVKVKPKLRKEMKSQGFEVFNSFALVPKDNKGRADKRYVEAINSGRPAGIKRLEPQGQGTSDKEDQLQRVQVDTIEVIVLELFDIHNYAELFDALITKKLDEVAKYDDEVYAFTFFGYHPLGSRTFFDGPELAAYLEHYKWTEESFDNFELVRLRMGDVLGPTPDYIYKQNRKRNKRTVQDRRTESLKLRGRRAKENRQMVSVEHVKEGNKVRQQQTRNRVYADPAKHEEHKKKDAARKKQQRRTRKNSPKS